MFLETGYTISNKITEWLLQSTSVRQIDTFGSRTDFRRQILTSNVDNYTKRVKYLYWL